MVYVAAGNQKLRAGATAPASAYSRVIVLELHCPAGIGNDDFCYTPQLGNTLVLYSIDIWVYASSVDVPIGGFFYFMFGNAEPVDVNDIINNWSHIIPVHCGGKPGFRWFDVRAFHRRFTMAKLFTTNELRFGAVVDQFGPQAWEMTVAFEISEG